MLGDAQRLLDKQFKENRFLAPGVRLLLQKEVFDEPTRKVITGYLDQLDSGKPTDESVQELVQKFLPPVMVGAELVKDFEQLASKEPGLHLALSFLNDEPAQILSSAG